MPTKLKLLKDITSGKNQPYGKKWEVVMLISDHDGILIVEGKSGRFPVKKEDVTKPNQIN